MADDADLLGRLGELPFRDLGFARVDTHRELRQGAPEAILAEGKTPEEVEAIARALLEGDAGSVLVTRADAAAREALRRVAPDAEEDARARLAWVARGVPAARGLVTIVSGGTAHAPVVTEARVRAELIDLATHWVLGRPDVFLLTTGDVEILPRLLDAAERFERRPSDEDMPELTRRRDLAPLFV